MRVISIFLLAFLAQTTFFAHAQDNKQSVILKTGTQGIGVELAGMAHDDVSVRLGFNFFKKSFDYDRNGFDYNGKITLKNVNLLVDWYPFEGGFHLTGGVVWDKNKITGNAITDVPLYYIGMGEYTDAEIGNITQEIVHRTISPYVGLGFGRAVTKDGRWNVMADFGVIFTGSPKVTMLSEGGTLSTNSALLADLRLEEQWVAEDIEGYKFYPIASLGLVYSF